MVRPEQSENALAPMLVTLSGMLNMVRPEQSSKALAPIVVTLSGMVTVVSAEQLWNALAPTVVTGSPSISAGMMTMPSEPVYLVMVTELPSLV